MKDDSSQIQEYKKAQDEIVVLKQKVEELLVENNDYKRLYTSSTLNYQSLDQNGNFLKVNQTWLNNLGYDSEEVIGHNFSEFLDPSWQRHFKSNFPKLRSLGEVMGGEFELVKKNGQKILVSLNGHISKDDDGNFQQTYCVFEDITERRLLEEALEKSEERFRLAMDGSKDGLWDWNVETDEVYYSPNYSTMLGYSENDVSPDVHFWLSLIHPDDKVNVLNVNSDCIEKRCENFQIEFRMRCQNGQWRWILGRGMAVKRGADDKALRLIGTHTDITHHKGIEDRLRRGERKMRSIFRAAPVGIGVVSQRVFTEVNALFSKMTGYSKDELIGKNAGILYCREEEYEKIDSEKYRQIFKNGTDTVETRMRRKDGTVFDVLLRSSPLNHDNLLEGVSFTALDITEAKKVELRLRESEKKYRSMMESMIDPVYICTSDLKITYMNPAMIKRVGRDAIGESCFKALHDQDNRCTWCVFSVESDEHYEIDVVSPLDEHSYHVCSSPIPQPDGSSLKLTVYRDTTELKNIQEQLQQAQKMKSIGNLAGGIAHDFNNILSAIIGYTEIATAKSQEDSRVKGDLQMVLQAANRATDLVKQILTFSRKSSQEKKPVLILLIVKEAMKMMRSSLPSSIAINIQYDLMDEMVLADPTEIHQIVINLCTNALHAMQDQKGTIQVSLRKEHVDSGKVSSEWQVSSGTFSVLTVEDSGYGMDNKTQKQIFEPYFTTKERGEGTGLGLAVVHGIVKQCNGFIEIESEIGKGSRFLVHLPLFERDLPKISDKPKIELLPVGYEHILFVDDEKTLCEIGKLILEKLGYRVTVHHSSKEALDLFKANPDSFDLIISDQTMPEMTGSLLALEIFRLRPTMPFILCTGYTTAITKEKALAIGISRFIEKPVSKSTFANAIRAVLDESKTKRMCD